MDTWAALEKFGIPIASVIGLALFIWRYLLPAYIKSVENVQAILERQLKYTEERADRKEADLLRAINEIVNRLDEKEEADTQFKFQIIQALQSLGTRVKE